MLYFFEYNNKALWNPTITGHVVDQPSIDVLQANLETTLQNDVHSTNIEIKSISQNLDGLYELNVSFVSSLNEEQGFITFHGLNDPSKIASIESGHYGRFSSDIVFVNVGDATFTSATIRLPTYAPTTKLLKCENFYWNSQAFNCSQWQNVSIPFQEVEGGILFNVSSFSGYVGTSYTYDNFEASFTNYCNDPPSSIWSGSICSTGAGSFNIIQDVNFAFLDKKYGNVSKSNSENSSLINVFVYDSSLKTFVYESVLNARVYVNVQSLNIGTGNNMWKFLDFGDSNADSQAFLYFDENESLGCGYYAGSGTGTLTACPNQVLQNLTLGQWSAVELHYNKTGRLQCWLNSSLFCNASSLSVNNEAIRYWTLGVSKGSTNNATGTLLFDEYRAAASDIGAYPSISNITVSNLSVYDDQNFSLWALISDPDAGDSIQTAYVNKSSSELFLFPELSPESRAGTLTLQAGNNYSLIVNESLYDKNPSSSSFTLNLFIFANDSVGQVQKGTASITVLDGNPTVSLDTPPALWSNTGNMTLNCSATDPSNNLYNISLYTNQSGVAAINQTQNISGNASSVSFNLTNLGEGVYGWNCEAYDTESLDGDAANSDTGDVNKTFTVDMTSPGSITNLTNESASLNWIKWNWSNPTNDDFNHTEVWLNNSWLANVSSPTNNYVATGLTNTTNYTVSIRTVDHAGNVNTTFVNNTVSTNAEPDTTPPSTITDLTNVSVTDSSITWNWTNPNESDYNHVELYVNGSFVANVSYTMHNYTGTGLQNNTNYMLSTRTVDHSGNINTTWINHTVATAIDTTAPGTISNLLVINRDSSWLQWNWSNANGDYNHSLVYLNGSYVSAVYAPDHQYTASNLLANSVYMLSVLSVDHYDNVNTTWINNSAQTNASYCGDVRCDTGESCSSCPVDCGECPVGEQVGGNAPVVTIVQTEPKVSRAWDKLDPNAEITWRIYDNTIAIKELSFTTKKAMEHPEISITTYANRPVGLYESVSGLLYYYLQVQTKNMDSSSLKDLSFQVAVEKAWLDANQLAAADVVVYRYTSDWVALPTSKKDENSLVVTYTAETPGFSYFAIAGKKPEPIVIPPEEEEPAPVIEVLPPVHDVPPKEPEIERPLVVPSNTSEPRPEPWRFIIPEGDLLMLLGFTALLIVFSGVKYLRQKKKKVLTNDQTL